MHRALIALTAIAAAATPAAAERLAPEAQLARAIEGRVAGEPVNCIDTSSFGSSQIIDGTAIIYERLGGTIYVNRPRAGERSLDRFDVLVTEIRGGQLCRGDVVRLVDPSVRMQTGMVFLGDFVPYRRVRD
jgi:hypothetical protein